jgi:hypothetical protein
VKAKNDVALKDSHFTLKLLGEGKIISFLREIDAVDRDRRPDTPIREFFLFPGSQLPAAEAVKPNARADLDSLQEATRNNMGMVKFRYYAVLRAVARIADLEATRLIQDEHPWLWDEVKRRFERSPDGLYLWIARVFEMANPLMLVERPMYDGTHHWVRLEAALSTRGARPVLPKDVFERRVAAIRTKLSGEA